MSSQSNTQPSNNDLMNQQDREEEAEPQAWSDQYGEEDEDEEMEDDEYLETNSFDDEEEDEDFDGEPRMQPEQSQEEIAKQQQILRQRILEIQRDESLSAGEKAKRIQTLMTQQWSSKHPSREQQSLNRLQDKRDSNFDLVREADQEPTYHNQEMGILGCKHYQRACKLQAHCCGKWFTCRFCHDEVSDHNIVRNLTTTMMCMYCKKVQPAGQDCIECGKRVAKYYCHDCKLWDDDPRKNIYHCHDCGICRIGKGLGIDYFHCKTCNICMASSLKGRHKCIERNLESDCPICGEYMFTSTTTVIFMPCGHCIHYKCHQEYTQTNYQCPTCFKSLANMTEYFRRIDQMLEQHTMPPEYANMRSYVYCNDCEKKCWSKFHFLYHKCIHCNGYNTKVVKTTNIGDGEDPMKEQELRIQSGRSADSVAGSSNPSQSGSPSTPGVLGDTTNVSMQHAHVHNNSTNNVGTSTTTRSEEEMMMGNSH